MIITNAHLISPGLDKKNASVTIENGRICEIGELTEGDLDLGGKMLLPGFIDIHSHGADGADVCDASTESLEHIAQTKRKEGVTTWLPTTLTQPAERLIEITKTIRDWAPSAPLHIPGFHLEGPFLNIEKTGAQNPQFLRDPDLNEIRALHSLFPVSILSIAPELSGAFNIIREAMAMGIICSGAHSTADYEIITRAMGYGLKHLTHFGNAMTGLHHRGIGAVGAGLLEKTLKLEVIADGIHLAPEMLELIFANVPRANIMLITDSVAASWQDDGESSLGGLEVEIRDGVARLKSDGTLAGSTLRYPQGLQLVHELTGESLSELVTTTSWNQARALGYSNLGKIEEGFTADLVVLNDKFEVERTFIDGV